VAGKEREASLGRGRTNPARRDDRLGPQWFVLFRGR
jgi:hypothetical protein